MLSKEGNLFWALLGVEVNFLGSFRDNIHFRLWGKFMLGFFFRGELFYSLLGVNSFEFQEVGS